MSIFDYMQSKELSSTDPSFYALIMAAMRKADSVNIERLKSQWPEVWGELQARYHAPAGALTEDELVWHERWYAAKAKQDKKG